MYKAASFDATASGYSIIIVNLNLEEDEQEVIEEHDQIKFKFKVKYLNATYDCYGSMYTTIIMYYTWCIA